MIAARRLSKSLLCFLRFFVRRQWLRIRNLGFNRYCPLCRSHLRCFLAAPWGNHRADALCPVCECLERDRCGWLFLQRHTDLFNGVRKRFLHIASEWELGRRIKWTRSIDYLSADLRPIAMAVMDLTDIHFPDNTFDVIYCSHVLSEIPDDRKALTELQRVLKPTGWAILQVAIRGDITTEISPTITPEERERVYGDAYYVRMFGRDYPCRLKEAGFAVSTVAIRDIFSAREIQRCRLVREEASYIDEEIYVCRKS